MARFNKARELETAVEMFNSDVFKDNTEEYRIGYITAGLVVNNPSSGMSRKDWEAEIRQAVKSN